MEWLFLKDFSFFRKCLAGYVTDDKREINKRTIAKKNEKVTSREADYFFSSLRIFVFVCTFFLLLLSVGILFDGTFSKKHFLLGLFLWKCEVGADGA